MPAAKRTPAKKPVAKKPVAKKTVAKKTVAKKPVAKKATTAKRTTTKRPTATPTAKRGDVILIDSARVGSPPREGEVLKIVRGEVSVSYWVRWVDGHESFITPRAESVQIGHARKA